MGPIGRAARGGALLFLDVDNLKPVNDQLGHEAGDALLIAVANLLRRVARPTDLMARIGGDEFALWLDGVTEEAVAASRAEALCAGATGILLAAPSGTTRVPVSVSIGAALSGAGPQREMPEVLLARADAALYAAKREGRSTWRMADGPPGPA
jgi:diguanylate cyclase (GGDEF)-like protein